jgi:hypothetical protein
MPSDYFRPEGAKYGMKQLNDKNGLDLYNPVLYNVKLIYHT